MKDLAFRDASRPFGEGLFAQAYLQSIACRFAVSALWTSDLDALVTECLDAVSLTVDAASVQIIETSSEGGQTIRARTDMTRPGGTRRGGKEEGTRGAQLDFPLPGRVGPIGLLRVRFSANAASGDELEFLTAVANAMGAAMQRSGEELRLRQEQERLRRLVDAELDRALIALDPEGRIITWSSGAVGIWGYSAGEVMGRHVSVLFSCDDAGDGTRSPAGPNPAEAGLAEAARSGRLQASGWFRNANRSPFFASVVVTPIRDAQGTLTGFAHLTTPAVLSPNLRSRSDAATQKPEAAPSGGPLTPPAKRRKGRAAGTAALKAAHR
jgi:PAS domain-containing protein